MNTTLPVMDVSRQAGRILPSSLRPLWLWLWAGALLLAGAASSLSQTTVLLGPTVTNTIWRYDRQGTELHGTGWEQPTFDDSAWPTGRALLGQEDNAAITPLTNTILSLFLPGSTTVRVTSYWFRVHFTMPYDPAPLGSAFTLIASNHVDDGYVMYLNGFEIDRFNMPGTPGLPDIRADTKALVANPPAEPVRTNRNLGNPINLFVGDNVIAVEVHQAGDTSSDVLWGMTLKAVVAFAPTNCDLAAPANTNGMQCRPFTLTCCFDGSPAPVLQWFRNGVPVPDGTNASLTISNAQASDAGQYFCQAINPQGFANSLTATVTVTPDMTPPTVVSVVADASGTNVVVTYSEPMNPGDAEDEFNYIFNGADFPQSAILTAPNTVRLHFIPPLADCAPHTLEISIVSDACVGLIINPNPTTVTFVKPVRLLAIDDTHLWKYHELGVDLGTSWRLYAYDDSGWSNGLALLAQEGAGLPEPIRTPLTVSTNKPTFYFRTHFNLPTDPSRVTRLQLRQVLDDGAVYYINGVEVFRSRITAGVDFNTLAVNQPVDPAQYEGPFDLPLTALRCGDNVLAVEVHQSALTSSDVVLGAELTIELNGPCLLMPCRPRPAITDFFPREGGEGTLVTIIGGPFHGGSPDDHCAVMMKGNRFIDIEVLTASPTQLVARVGVIPPDCFGPLQLMVGVGEGGRVPLCPLDPAVQVAPENWIWRGDAVDGAVAPGPFVAVPATPGGNPPGVTPPMNFHSGPPMSNMLSIVLTGDWGVGSRYCISARIHAGGTGADTRIGPATFTGNGNRFQCAAAICDLLVKAFASHPQRPIFIDCTVITNGLNAVIKISLTNGVPIDGGNIDIIQKSPPPVIAGLWDIQNSGIWRKEYRAHELARWYRHFNWTSVDRIWFERRAEGLWITRQAVETFTANTHCIYRLPNGGVWIIWRTFRQQDLVRFWVHYRFWWPGRLNPLLATNNPAANRTMMSMDEVQLVMPMTPADPNPATPFNEAVMIVDQNGQQHFQGQPGFEQMPDIAGNPNGFQLVTTAHSTDLLPPAAQRIVDTPMQPMPGMAQLQPGVIIQWLVSANGNVLVDHNNDGWPDPLHSAHVLGGQKHPGMIAQPTGIAGTNLPVNFGNTPPQLYCWELSPNGEVRGAAPGQLVVGPAADVNLDGQPDGPVGGPVAMDPSPRMLVVNGGQVQEVNSTMPVVDVAVEEEGPPTDPELAAMNQNLAAQIPGFVPLQRPFVLCIRKIKVRNWWGIDRRVVFDCFSHHWTWQHRNHIILTSRANRVWLTKVSLSQYNSSHHAYITWPVPHAVWSMYNLTHVRFFRICFRVVTVGPNQIALKVDQMHVVVPEDPNNPNSRLALLSTQSDENKLFQEVPPAVLAGLQPDPLPVGPDGVFVEPIDPVGGTLDIGLGGAGVLGNRPVEARGMAPVMLAGNPDAPRDVNNNQLQLYCWALNPNGTIAQESFLPSGFAPAAGQPITLAISPTPAIPSFEDEEGNVMDNPTVFESTFAVDDNTVRIVRLPNGNFELSWDGPGQLQSSDALLGNGPPTIWTDVPFGSLSPVTVPGNLMKRFYHVRR